MISIISVFQSLFENIFHQAAFESTDQLGDCRLCGGIIILSTASFRSGEYRMHEPPVPLL
jgi:hypothetical protein